MINYHEIYARHLLSDDGFASYYPRPVDIAEVGYVDNGFWIPLFNASKKPGDESNKLGVPNGYRPLDVGELVIATIPGGSPITSERGTSLRFGGSSAAAIPVTSADGQYTFTSSKQEGAILVPGDIIDTADALDRSRYIRYIRENSASWLEFANERHHRNIRLSDLVLVTGWHKTASWGCAAFSLEISRKTNLTFNFCAGTTQGGVWGQWSDIDSPGVDRHSGPQALGTDSPNIRDQGIFIRGYKICDKQTGLGRIFHRHGKDSYGFTVVHLRDDDA